MISSSQILLNITHTKHTYMSQTCEYLSGHNLQLSENQFISYPSSLPRKQFVGKVSAAAVAAILFLLSR